VDENVERECAMQPEDLSRLIVERLNDAAVDGLVALYEPNAVLALPGGQVATAPKRFARSTNNWWRTDPPFTPGVQRPTLCSAGLALTSSRLVSDVVTAEVPRRQLDGTWLWVLDRPNVLE